MLIVCPNCATSYRVDPSSLGAAGRSVRCVRCRSVWFADDPTMIAAVPDGDRRDATAAAEQGPAEYSEAPPEAPPPTAMPAPAPESIEAHDVPEQHPSTIESPPGEQAAPPRSALPGQDVLPADHEPITIADAPVHATVEHDATVPLADATVGEDVETVAARRAKARAARRRFHLPVPGLPAAIMALIAINTILVGWRADVVKVLPQTASLYAAIGLPINLRGLAFAGVTTTAETQDGVPVLVVEGAIVGTGQRVVEVPRLRFAVRNPKGQEIYAWTALPTRSVLAPGETLAFRSRLASPPSEANDVTVRFFSRRDRVAGIQ
jgi:predicted Zn finger-like uncharacterized protein